MLYAIRHKDSKKYFAGKADIWRYFLKSDPSWKRKKNYNEIYTHEDVHSAELYVSEKNAIKAIKDATGQVKKYPLGFTGLPVDKCEIVKITFNVLE